VENAVASWNCERPSHEDYGGKCHHGGDSPVPITSMGGETDIAYGGLNIFVDGQGIVASSLEDFCHLV